MKLFEKPAFRWKEPKAYLKARAVMDETRTRWWHKPVRACVFMLMLLVPWATARLNPAKQPPAAEVVLPMILVAGLFLAYGIPWLQTIIPAPSEVRMFGPRVIRQHWGTQCWDYAQMRGFDWIAGPEYHVLMLKYGPQERVVSLGLPADMDTEAVSAFLLSKGVPRAPTPPHQESAA